jgi:hypothetical protein
MQFNKLLLPIMLLLLLLLPLLMSQTQNIGIKQGVESANRGNALTH